MGKITRLLGTAVCLLGLVGNSRALAQPPAADIRLFLQAAQEDEERSNAALQQIAAAGWRDGYAAIIRDMMRLMQPPRPPAPTAGLLNGGGGTPDVGGLPGSGRPEPQFEVTIRREHPSTKIWRRLLAFVEEQTGEGFDTLDDLQRWIWARPPDPHPDYALFKGVWYSALDERFRDFFPAQVNATIRLDEVDWGGVVIDGIPELEYPRTMAADAADYLDDDHVVFGIYINGEARAYPKRILAWHEMAIDRLGGVELTIVYCTLCGTVIPYESVVGSRHVTLGTSGFLYRSNKLMFDEETKSLWNTFEGVPVVGPLVGTSIRLRHRSAVTTTWAAWRRRHPETTVLSPDTGYKRDYREGAAYRQYFSTDRLMFPVPRTDDRLKNKDEVVTMLVEDATGQRHPVALSVEFLEDEPVYQLQHAGKSIVVVTSNDGANRVYDAGPVRFVARGNEETVTDETGTAWTVTEEALIAAEEQGRRLPRLAAQRAFWFGWYAQFPETVLVK